MLNRRRTLALASLTVFLSASTLLAQSAPPQQPRKPSNAERKEIELINKKLTDVAGGQAAPNDLNLTWVDDDLLKAQGNQQYIPFTVTIDPSKVSGGKLSFYWRVIDKAGAPADADAKKDDKKAPAKYAFENFHTVEVKGGQAPMRISRAFVVPAGTYDVVVVAKEIDTGKKNVTVKTSVLQHELTVTNLWSDELVTSSVIVAERIDPLPAPLTPAQQEERPYALGNMEIVPAASTALTKKDELSVFLLIYNAKVDAANAPDVTVEYNFYTTQAGAEKFFNKTNPQSMNAQTLPPGFDPAAGITNGQTIPLASFPEGDYRLEIKITDKLSSKSLTRDVKFSVAGS